MASPAHHLRRLRLQVHSADQASAQALRSQFEAGLSRRLAHVVAAVCDDLGPQEEVLRIDRLDLPLGAFAIEELEREAPLALERALREALLQALAAARHNPAPGQRLLAPAEARLDRLATFLRHGLLPHRVASEPFAPADDLRALLRADPASLLVLLRRLAGERSALERLLLQLDPERLALLLAALAPADAALILAYLADLLLLHQQRPLLPVDADRLRRSLWLVTLTLLLRDPGTPFNRRSFLDQLLRSLAAEHRLPYSRLLRQLEVALRTYSRLQPLGGSLPALLAELIGLRRSLAPALARANRDPEPLLALLRADPGNAELHRALEPRLSAPLFAVLVRALEPGQAPLVLATVADVALVHRQQPLLPLAADPFERLVRRIALQLLLHPTGSPYERLSFLRQLLRQLAQSQQLIYSHLLRTFATALRRLPRPLALQTSLPALLDSLLAVELGTGAQAAAAPAPDQGLAAAISPEAGDAEPAEASLRPSARRLPPPPFAAELWSAFLRDGHPAHLGPRLMAAVERDPASFAALLRALLADAGSRPGEAPPMVASASHDQIPLARLLRWLPPEALAALAAAASAEPHPPPLFFARWAEWLADAPGADLAAAWGQLLSQRLADPLAPLPALPALAAGHLDRLALLRSWLGLAPPPPWLTLPPEPPAWVAPLLRGASELELRRLLQIPTAQAAAVLLALRRLQGLLAAAPQPRGLAAAQGPDAAVFDQLLERLLPWLQQPSGPLAEALARAPSAADRAVVRLRAVALALAGEAITLEELGRALPPLAAAATAPGERNEDAPAPLAPASAEVVAVDAPPSPTDRQRLLAWLADEGPEVPAQLPTLLRLFAQLADQGDAELVAVLRRGARQAAPRQRWQRQLPEALLGRVVLLLEPGRGRLLLDLQALLSLAWRQAALPGDPPPPPGLPWDTLLPLLVAPQPLTTAQISDRLLRALSGSGDRQQPAADRLLRQARQLATATGAEPSLTAPLPLLAALEPPPPPDPVPAQAPATANPWASPETRAETQAETSLSEAFAEGLYIANAGLVLFNPFLPRFFERLGLLTPAADDDGAPSIQGLEARSRAVHLLQWLVDGRLETPEPDLALNKVLAGIDLSAPILPGHAASDDDLAIAQGLLEAVIQHWPPLANTSLAGLRETFLLREGRLELPTMEINQWTLVVQRRTVDILMNQMPWPLSPVRHRWMPAPLFVDWS
jgi:hypothetical protein